MPIKILHGTDREAMMRTAKRILGDDYEVVEAENIDLSDLDSIFRGVSLFDDGSGRKILIKDLSLKSECFEKLPDYADTSFNVVVVNDKLNKTFAYVKNVFACKDIEVEEFITTEEKTRDKFENCKPFQDAYAGRGADAIRKLRKIESRSAAPLIIGTMAGQCIKLIDGKNKKPVQALKIIAEADMMTKSSGITDIWMPVEWALLEISKL